MFGVTPAFLRFYPANVCMDLIAGRACSASGLILTAALIGLLYFVACNYVLKMWTGASVDSPSAKTSNGAVSCEFEAALSECKLSAVSGAVTIGLPEDSDFIANISITSGNFESDFALQKDGSTYICGSGSADIDIDTTSGNVSIRQN